MSPEVLDAWAAGVLEGEGCFSSGETYTVQNGKEYGPYKLSQILLQMTDHDVVRKVADHFGVGHVSLIRPRQPHHKAAYIWRVAKQADVLLVLDRIAPYMGSRRSEKIAELRANLIKGGQ